MVPEVVAHVHLLDLPVVVLTLDKHLKTEFLKPRRETRSAKDTFFFLEKSFNVLAREK